MFLPPKGICMHNSRFSMCTVSQAILIADVFMQLLGTILRMCKRSCVQLLVWFVLVCNHNNVCSNTYCAVCSYLNVFCLSICVGLKKFRTLVEVFFCEKSVTTLSSIFICIATYTYIEHCFFCSSVPLEICSMLYGVSFITTH